MYVLFLCVVRNTVIASRCSRSLEDFWVVWKLGTACVLLRSKCETEKENTIWRRAKVGDARGNPKSLLKKSGQSYTH